MGLASHTTLPMVERGQGTPVVFLHGYPLSHEIWEPQLGSLSVGHRVVLLDLPGYGLAREWPVPDSLAGFAEMVHRTLNRHFSSPIVVVGHSFGGYVALEMFRDHPGQFRALVLTDTRSEADGAEAREKRLATARRLEDPAQHLDVEATARGLVSPRTWERTGPLPETVRRIVRDVPSRTIIGTLKAIAGRSDLTPVLSTIQVPALVIWGEEDTLIPPAQSRAMVDRIRGSSGVGIPEAGHLPSMEAPERFAKTVGDFLARL
jgi:pimeloyl-ACP methyl ester carboxylesterase